GAKLPNLLHDPNHGPKTVEQFFDTSAFAVPPPFAFGNEGIGSVYGPSLTDMDLSLIKNTSIRERMNLQFRFEAFNALNHPLRVAPVHSFGTPQYGRGSG